MDLPLKNEWLADLLMNKRELITQFWIEDIRAEEIQGYNTITDEQLRDELPPTVDSMITAFRTGDTEGPRKHSIGVIQRRIADGLKLPDLQMSLHALETAVMRIVKDAELGTVKEFEALTVANNMYYLVALIAAAVYDQLRTEQQRRFTVTYEFGITLSKILDLDTILNIAVDKVAEYFDGESVAILLAGSDDNRDELRAYHNFEKELAKAIPDICNSFGCSRANLEGVELGQITRNISDVRNFELLAPWLDLLISSKRLSMVCMPLIAKQRRLGEMVVMWSDVHTSTTTELEFMFALAGHIAGALQNAILYEDAKGKRELGILLDSSRLFASSLDTQDIIHKIAEMSLEAARADISVVFIRSRMREQSDIAYYVRRDEKIDVRRIVDAIVSEEKIGFSIFGSEFADGKAVLYSSITEFPQIQALAGENLSGMAIPLRQKDVFLGAIVLISLDPNAFSKADLVLASGLGDLASVAIENARLYEYERNIAETLQRSFLPRSLPVIEGYENAAFYRPAMAEAEIGGDFYDVFETSDGKVSLIIGDVSGKGLKAAIPTAMGRYLVRAYAAENPMPNSVLTRFNRTFFESVSDDMFMTALYGTLDPKNNLLTYVSAGHNPPLLYSSASNQVEEIEAFGLCLGITADVECIDMTIEMQPGDALLLYTDGATDVKGDVGRLGDEGLKQLFLSNVSADESAEQIVAGVSKGICEYGHGTLSDDVALIVLKRLQNNTSNDS